MLPWKVIKQGFVLLLRDKANSAYAGWRCIDGWHLIVPIACAFSTFREFLMHYYFLSRHRIRLISPRYSGLLLGVIFARVEFYHKGWSCPALLSAFALRVSRLKLDSLLWLV